MKTLSTLLRDIRDIVVSLKLTVMLLLFSMVLVFAGTLDQVNLGIWAVQEKYFRSFVVYLPLGRAVIPAFPGGYTVGGLLLVNLVAAHIFRFRLEWKKMGIILTHLGLIVLLVGELLTGLWQEDAQMRLAEGETKNYAESARDYELVMIDISAPERDLVVSIPESLLARKAAVQLAQLPFRVVVKTYYGNSMLVTRPADTTDSTEKPMTGAGAHLTAVPQPVTSRTDERNIPSAVIDLVGTEGVIGTYLVSAQLPAAQTFSYAGRAWTLALRPQRLYHPFSLTLMKFSHDKYPGTEIPRNFSSRLRLNANGGNAGREVLIYMNNPLREGGLTFYQAGFENDDRTTILQVVRNPSWLMPYLACGVMTVGLILHFGVSVFQFGRKRKGALFSQPPATVPTASGSRPATTPQVA